jgi:hypothetical protein
MTVSPLADYFRSEDISPRSAFRRLLKSELYFSLGWIKPNQIESNQIKPFQVSISSENPEQ